MKRGHIETGFRARRLQHNQSAMRARVAGWDADIWGFAEPQPAPD
jgi:hypothetical protein